MHYTLEQFTIEGQLTRHLEGPEAAMRRAMRRSLDWAIGAGVPFHAVLINPQGQVVAVA